MKTPTTFLLPLLPCASFFPPQDVEDVKFVINYDYPNSSEDYIHRIGRTARSTNKGTAYTFFTPGNLRQARELVRVLEEARQAINPKLLQLVDSGRGGGGGGKLVGCIQSGSYYKKKTKTLKGNGSGTRKLTACLDTCRTTPPVMALCGMVRGIFGHNIQGPPSWGHQSILCWCTLAILKNSELWLFLWGHVTGLPAHCGEVYGRGHRSSGVYPIKPNQSQPFLVYCDMSDGKADGGSLIFFMK